LIEAKKKGVLNSSFIFSTAVNMNDKSAVTMHIGNMSKTFAFVLTVILALSFLTLISTKSVFAQSTDIPSVSIVYPTDSTVFNVSIEGVFVQVLYQTNDTLSWVGFSIEGQQLGGNVTCTGNVTDYTEFIKDNYQFDFGHPTLTLYANDTEGNWAIPQTVTYTVYFYPDVAPLSSSSSSNPTSTPVIPEFCLLTIAPLLLSVFAAAVAVKHRKTDS
jgi:hypothetical protein